MAPVPDFPESSADAAPPKMDKMDKMEIEWDPSSPEVMLAFYKRLFPYKPFFHWLNHDHTPSRLFTHREFAFTLAGDVYLRYNSFNTAEDFRRELCRLNPSRFEIGAIYNARPRDKRTLRAGALVPLQRELVFDIDMTDYDSIRTCCSGKGICKRCWGFIGAAVVVVDEALRNQFGYEHLLWVYSGRRGIHCWVSDRAAMALTDVQRSALVSYLEVIKGSAEQVKKVNVRVGTGGAAGPLPPSLEQAIEPEMLGKYFQHVIIEDQKCFDSEEGAEGLLGLIPDRGIVSKLRKMWGERERDSQEKWDDLKAEVHNADTRRQPVLLAALEDIILQYTYPRLDAEVSKHRNHLLKAPFCVHPGTGRVCVPVDPKRVDEFDPEGVPTVGLLLNELNAAAAAAGVGVGKESARGEWEHTSLRLYVDMLERHVRGIVGETREMKRGELDVFGCGVC